MNVFKVTIAVHNAGDNSRESRTYFVAAKDFAGVTKVCEGIIEDFLAVSEHGTVTNISLLGVVFSEEGLAKAIAKARAKIHDVDVNDGE